MAHVRIGGAVTLLALLALAGCGGGGGGSSTVPAPPAQQHPAATQQKAITLLIPASKGTSAKSQYISTSTLGVGISFGASPFKFPANTTPTAAFDLSSGSVCTTPAPSGARTCTLTVTVPLGNVDFQITAWDCAPTSGSFTGCHALGAVTVLNQNVQAGVSTPISLSVNGVVSSIALSVSPTSLDAGPTAANGGTNQTVTLTANALDSSGNMIMGNGGLVDATGAAITIGVTQAATASGGPVATTLASPTFAPGSQTMTVTYPGGNSWGTVFTPVVTGGTVSTLTGTTLAITPAISLFTIPTTGSQPNAIAAGSDGNVWFTEATGSKVASITPSGTFTEISLSSFFPTAVPAGIVAAPNGNMYWLDQSGAPKMEYVTPPGSAASLGVSSLDPSWIPSQMIVGPDGLLWYTQLGSGSVGDNNALQSYNTSGGGSSSNSAPPSNLVHAVGLTVGPDGNIWFCEESNGSIQYLTFSGGVSTGTFSSVFGASGGPSAQPYGIASGPDGNLWFTAHGGAYVGVMNTSGSQIQTYTTPATLGNLAFIVKGPDNAMWFTGRGPLNPGNGGIGRITTAGVMTTYFTGLSTADDPQDIVVGPDGNIWFDEPSGNKIGRLIY